MNPLPRLLVHFSLAFAATVQAQPPVPSPSPVPVLAAKAPPIASATVTEAPRNGDGVFGASLFRGRFAAESVKGFNPDYTISIGDRVDLKLWGATEFSAILEVDAQGNIFVPRVGPIAVANVRNGELNELIAARIRSVYRDNVGVYASLAAAEPVRVFVTGYVVSPGMYGAYASDSLLHYLDKAGGIDLQTGSFLDVRVLRGGQPVARFNLYDFLLRGELPLFQFRNGDTIVVWPKKSTVKVSGLVRNAGQFEFEQRTSLKGLLDMAGLDQRATHVLLQRNQTPQREAEYLPIDERLDSVHVSSGDEVIVFADRQIATIILTVEGEFEGLSQIALPYESTLADLMGHVDTNARSNLNGLQLYRRSIADRQRQVLDQMLRKLEA
ncbi:polysaccharide biosynthesis/export family protein [Sinimarinibacterium thermocellulolyticum]|uniref:Polysaccharide biosynthesis/export family protein n=1 Tax=Sinimarinibacterium thermocellulolyticum TaxID=3170016 RepID=A0ABV2ADW0_9GAMM